MRIRTRLRSVIHRIRPPKPKPLILLYHRIANEPIDPWNLAVSPGRFEEQLQVIRHVRHPMRLAEFVCALKDGTLPANAVALTFDDGYVDNLVFGKPRLAAADVPATVFVATGYTDRPEGFWWDEVARLILLEKAPRNFEFVVGDETICCSFGAEPAECEDGRTGTGSKTRRAALLTIWQSLRRLSDDDRRSAMLQLRVICSGRRDRSTNLDRAMSREEVRALTGDGLVTIGAHTVTHPVLAGLEAGACQREITESKLACEALTNAPVTAFAYPYGAFDVEAREAVKAAGFTIGCSAHRGPATARSDFFALPRTAVPNLDGDEFERALRVN